jgi:hypothetical protein
MSAFLKWLASAVARWLTPSFKEAEAVTTTVVSTVTSTASLVSGDLGALGSEAVTFWNAVVAAAKVKFGDISLDAITAGDLLIVLTQVVADIPSPISAAASEALTIEKLAMISAPELIAAAKVILALAALGGVSIQGAIPGVSAADGGYPGPSGNPSWHH